MTDAGTALRAAIARLRAAGVDDAASDARRLMEHAAGIPAGMLSAHLPDRVPPAALEAFDTLVAARAARAPVAHLSGLRSFYGRDFRVTPDTLVPRPETELIVDLALDQPFSDVLDLGTGTGCILLTLLAERPGATGTGTDLSPAALAVAQDNAQRLGVGATFLHSDWFADVPGTFDLIVSNPPYIAAEEMPGLAPEVRDHEPRLALTDGADGPTAYRAIAAGAGPHLTPGGRLIVEIGHRQGAAVAQLFRDAGLEDIRIHPDLNGLDRAVSAGKPA